MGIEDHFTEGTYIGWRSHSARPDSYFWVQFEPCVSSMRPGKLTDYFGVFDVVGHFDCNQSRQSASFSQKLGLSFNYSPLHDMPFTPPRTIQYNSILYDTPWKLSQGKNAIPADQAHPSFLENRESYVGSVMYYYPQSRRIAGLFVMQPAVVKGELRVAEEVLSELNLIAEIVAGYPKTPTTYLFET